VSSGAVTDISVLVALLIGEPEAGAILDVLSRLDQCRISAVRVRGFDRHGRTSR